LPRDEVDFSYARAVPALPSASIRPRIPAPESRPEIYPILGGAFYAIVPNTDAKRRISSATAATSSGLRHVELPAGRYRPYSCHYLLRAPPRASGVQALARRDGVRLARKVHARTAARSRAVEEVTARVAATYARRVLDARLRTASRRVPTGDGALPGLVLQRLPLGPRRVAAGSLLAADGMAAVTLADDGDSLHLDAGAKLSFDTYFGAFFDRLARPDRAAPSCSTSRRAAPSRCACCAAPAKARRSCCKRRY
jgi:hypothetical protein